MASRLSFAENLAAPLSKPQEILTYSQLPGEDPVYDDSSLRYYYFPKSTLERHPIDLTVGFKPNKFDFDAGKSVYLDVLLKTIEHYEKLHGTKVETDIITWRGVWTSLIAISQPQANPFPNEPPDEFLVTKFDNQVFIAHVMKDEPRKQDDQSAKFMYTGYQFEHVATLNRPWGECTREEIENRYVQGFQQEEKLDASAGTTTRFSPKANSGEYGMLIRSKIGDVSLLYAAETDAVEGFKPKDGDLHRNYVELKTTAAIYNARSAQKFEQKLFRTWIQSFLSRVPRVVYGFKERGTELVSVETFQTEDLPKIIAKSTVTPKHLKWNAKRALGFFAILAKFLKDRVKEDTSYTLKVDQRTGELVLTPHEIKLSGRKVSFLSDEFVDWRRK